MKDIPTKTNGQFFEADECNSIASEEENLVKTAGQTLSASDNFQLSKAASIYASAGDFYEDAGAANTYVLNPIDLRYAPPSYVDGMKARFKPGVTNTGASTVNIDSNGIKDIKNRDGSAVSAGEIGAGDYVDIVYELSNDYFVITNRSDVTNNIPFGIAVESSSNVYTLDLGGVYSAYDDRTYFRCRFPTANTGTVTLNVDGIGAVALVDNGRGFALSGDEIEIGKIYLIAYSAASSDLRILNRIITTDAIMTSGASQTIGVAPGNVAKAVHQGAYLYSGTSGTNTYTASLTPNLTSTYLVTGSEFHIHFGNACTATSPTLNIDGTGAKEIKSFDDQTLNSGDILAASMTTLIYDGTNYRIKSMIADTNGAPTLAGISKNIAITPFSAEYHPGVAKVLVYFDGDIATPLVGYNRNVSSITDNAGGDYTVNFTVTMSATTYVVLTISDRSAINHDEQVHPLQTNRSTTTCRVQCLKYDGSGLEDGVINFAAFGDLA